MADSTKSWREWMHEHVRPRDLLALLGLPAALVIGVLSATTPGLDAAVRATGITASIGAITTTVGYYFGRGEATSLAREAANLRSMLARAQGAAIRNAAELDKTVALVASQTGVEPELQGNGGGTP